MNTNRYSVAHVKAIKLIVSLANPALGESAIPRYRPYMVRAENLLTLKKIAISKFIQFNTELG